MAPTAAGLAAAAPRPFPSPLKAGLGLPVDDAIQSLLGLAEPADALRRPFHRDAQPSMAWATTLAAATARSAAGSPLSPEALLPAAGSASLPPQQQQRQAADDDSSAPGQRQQGGGAEQEPAAPATVATADALAVAPGGDATSQGAAHTGDGGAAVQEQHQRRASGRAGAAEETAAAALAAAADDGSETAAGAPGSTAVGEDRGHDPDWHAGARPKARGRPRKRRPTGAASAAAAAAAARQAAEGGTPVTCAHCGTGDTPRWWKENFAIGTLCNACGIWLKRHGYPRPVQFFVNLPAAPAGSSKAAAAAGSARAAAAAAAAASDQQQQQQQQQQQAAAEPSQPEAEYYLINGRPKRRRLSGPSPGAAAAAASGESGEAAAPAADPPINFGAAGSRVFVVRRKLLKAEGSPEPGAALVHFAWAPAARAAHEMFSAVARFGEGSPQVTVDDFELLSDCKATATLQARPGAAVASWDALVRAFVDGL